MNDDQLVERLKAAQPSRVRVYDVDGVHRDVSVAKHRRRWSALAATISHYSWERVECLDGRGGVVAVITREAPPAAGLEDLATSPAGKAGEVTAQASGLLALMLKAQDVALERQHRMMQTVMDQQSKLLGLVADRLTAAERAQREDLRTIRELVLELADTEAHGIELEGQSGNALMALAPQLLAALAGKRKGPEGSPPGPGPNGKAPKRD